MVSSAEAAVHLFEQGYNAFWQKGAQKVILGLLLPWKC